MTKLDPNLNLVEKSNQSNYDVKSEVTNTMQEINNTTNLQADRKQNNYLGI